MKITFSALAIFVAVIGVASFLFLVLAIGTDFWYIIDASKWERRANYSLSLSSHSGLWRTCNFQSKCWPLVNPFGVSKDNYTHSQRQLLNMHGALVVLLPLSLIVIIFGDILGFISILARARSLLLLTGVLLLFGALITLAGISVYVAYSAAAFQEALSAMRSNTVKDVDIRFGWSVALAWASFISELSVGCALLLASRAVRLQGGQEQEL